MTKEELVLYVNQNISPMNPSTFEKLEALMDSTLKTNEKFNLTAIKEEEFFRELMIYDSLLPIKYFDFKDKKVVDVGTGAGFPGLPLAICTKGQYTLIDSTQKKIDYINDYIKKNKFKNVTAISGRAEDIVKNKRDMFDFAIARAVASLNVLLELTVPFLKVGGSFIALKGSSYEKEIFEARMAIKGLNVEITNVYVETLPLTKEVRSIIEFKKIKPTSKKYPRIYKDIKEKPL